MEKFTNFRDPGTGISPYMPIREKSTKLASLFKAIVFLISLFVKGIPLLLLFFVSFIPISALKQLVLKIMLMICGVQVDLTIDGVKRSNVKTVEANKPQNGDFIVVNYTSPLDGILLYTLNSNSLFVTFSEDGNQLISLSLKQVISHSISTLKVGGSPVKLKSLTKKCVYFIAEPTTSNGQAILPYNYGSSTKNLLRELKGMFKFKILTMRVHPGWLTTPLPVSKITYMYRILSLKEKATIRARIGLMEGDLTWELLRQRAGESGRLELVGKDMGVDKKREFVKKLKGL